MQTFTSLMDFSQSALVLDLSFQFLIVYQYLFVHSSIICFLVILLVDFHGDLCLTYGIMMMTEEVFVVFRLLAQIDITTY